MKAKKTIRKLPLTTRKIAHLDREFHSLARKLTNMVDEVYDLEFELLALRKAQERVSDPKSEPEPDQYQRPLAPLSEIVP